MVDAWGKSGNKGSRGISDGDLRGVSCCPLLPEEERVREGG